MKRLMSCLVVVSCGALLISNSYAPDPEPQGGARGVVLRHGPYKVVMSDPVLSRGWKAGTHYTESEDLTKMMNQLAIDGLKPLFTNVITERGGGGPSQDRLLIVCEKL